MTVARGKRERELDALLTSLMGELARMLVSAGITRTRFDQICRLAFFNAASSRARFSNERLNQSAIAAMTGLTRVQVRAFARQAPHVSLESRDRLDHLVEGWATDPQFSTQDYAPKRLSLTRGSASFTALARKYGRDLPAKSLLRELERHRYVTVEEGYVSLHARMRQTMEEVRICRIARALTDLLHQEDAELSVAPVRAVTLEISYPTPSDKARQLVHKRAVDGLRNYLAGVQTVGSVAAVDSPRPKKQSRRTRVRVALLSDDIGE